MGRVGLETPSKHWDSNDFLQSDAQSDARPRKSASANASIDSDLSTVAVAWPRLSGEVRRCILAMVKSASGEGNK